jgi:phosphoribosyl-AMP cyclohydrolase
MADAVNADVVLGGDPADTRPVTEVAVGILIDAEGRLLFGSRPAGKAYTGYWEFPGGKVEDGETVAAALAREFHEELGLDIDPADVMPWRIERVSYPHAHVRLHFCKVRRWRGTPQMREGQRTAWSLPPPHLAADVEPVLPGAWPALHALQAESETAAWLDGVDWDAQGLVPAIAQEHGSGDVLMFAWMNREALSETARTGRAVYWSRSRSRLWRKGEESGHVQQVHEIRLDCDADVVLLKVTQLGHEPGIACHTGRHSCFFNRLDTSTAAPQWQAVEPVLKDPESIYK